jgi:hypothetical protein
MRRLLARLFGCREHLWSIVWEPGPTGKGSEMVVCARCGEPGWRLNVQ